MFDETQYQVREFEGKFKIFWRMKFWWIILGNWSMSTCKAFDSRQEALNKIESWKAQQRLDDPKNWKPT